jgi:hypothetical protein
MVDEMSQPPKWNLTINDTSPIFFYCSAPGSCIDYQMVGAINPVSRLRLSSIPLLDLPSEEFHHAFLCTKRWSKRLELHAPARRGISV